MAFQTPTINYADFMGLPSFVNLLATNFISSLQSFDIQLFCSVFMTCLSNWHLNICYSFMMQNWTYDDLFYYTPMRSFNAPIFLSSVDLALS